MSKGRTRCTNREPARLSRREMLRWAMLAAGSVAPLAGARCGRGQDAENARDLVDGRTTDALARGWNYLARVQHEDGTFPGQMGRNVAVVGLAGLAWLSGGSLPRRGPFGESVQRTVDYIAAACNESGFIVGDDSVRRGPMYGQGFAALFLAETVGMAENANLDEKLRAAVGLILRAQNREGGWRYTPEPLDADLSVTITQVMALRAARNAGVFVPAEAIDGAIDYVRRSQNPDGGFMYQLSGGESRFPLTAGAIVALQNAGQYEGEALEAAYGFLGRRMSEMLSPLNQNYFFYAHYYAAQAMWQRSGVAFRDYYTGIRDVLLGMQAPDGSWPDLLGRHYATAMACLVLATPQSLLPIFQR